MKASLTSTVSQNAVFTTLAFSNIWSNSDFLIALPYPIGNVTVFNGYSFPGFFHPVFHSSVQIAQYSWLENVTFQNDNGFPNVLLNGTLPMVLHLTTPIMRVGPWQNSLTLSIGSGTSPLCFKIRVCQPLFARSNMTVG